MLVVIVIASMTLGTRATRCLTSIDEVNPKRYVHYDSKSLNMTLEVSDRATQQLATQIYKIILQEVLGYPRVEIVPQDDDFNLTKIYERLSGSLDDTGSIIPSAMVNLEVWVPPENNTMPLLDFFNVKEGGYIAPPGRFGWFIPIELVNSVRLIMDKSWLPDAEDLHWTVFRNQKKTAEIFSVTNSSDVKFIAENSIKNAATGEYYCNSANHPSCRNGMFIPDHCNSKHCALLLAPYYEATSFVIQHIEEMNLYVKVAWLGPNLKNVTKELTRRYRERKSSKAIVILSWTPSDIILPENKFISVAFKRCELFNSSQMGGCKYELNRLIKVTWANLEKIAKPAYDTLHRMFLTEENYDEMLLEYNTYYPQRSVYDVACNWLRNNSRHWHDWIQVSNKAKNIIYIGGIFPMTGSSYTAKGIVTAARMAKEAVNRNSSILRDYDLNLLVHDGQCRADMVMKRFIDYIVNNYYKNLLGVLGPACSDTVEPLAGVSRHYKTLMISYSAEGASFSDRKKYPYFFRTIGENIQYKHVYLAFLKEMGWNRVAALTEDGQKYTEYISLMHGMLEKQGITFIANTKFPRERDKFAMNRYLEDLKRKRARIIIADVYDEVARNVMCEAYKLGMTAQEGYVWFLPLWLSSSWYNTTYYNNLFNETVNCTVENMITAINGHLSLAHAYFAPDEAIMQENISVGEWKKNYSTDCAKQKIGVSSYAGYAYDAVWTFALALDKLSKEDPEAVSDLHSENTTTKLLNIVKATDFEGVSGRIKFRGGPSRFSVVNIVQWLNNTTHIVGSFYPNISDDKPEVIDGVLELNTSAIIWLSSDGKRPNDGSEPPPQCVFSSIADLLEVSCEIAIIVVNIIGFGFLGMILVVSIIIVKRRYDKKVQLTQKYMKSLGIDLLAASGMSSLDGWEVPRDRVVINRKLGEGAFGTVYGGEAYFDEKGWVGVAVKTLKVGSSTEEKLDFISEAEVMKRFEHKNVIRLLGVCTKNEPVYTIMEFMLYGDLKTFLLARRHLVNERIGEECEEISSKKLTNIALDVARALSYLAESKYVHRDVASRNCLVNSQRQVKLSDFGMTRPTFENDYYKFNRKGMLPVRWMSPESLGLGIFTPASDVWSYGVLLYEIITFGSFPFQGLSNNQVLEHVKLGNTISIPHGVKPQLEGLIKSCWNLDYKKRPQASEIVEFLANNSRLISPCLDVPLASVQMENTGQLELDIPASIRKCSLTISNKLEPFTPNGIIENIVFRHNSIPVVSNSAADSGIALQMDGNCIHEPLLGQKRSPSQLNLSKYVRLQHGRSDSGCTLDEGYCNHKQPDSQEVSIV